MRKLGLLTATFALVLSCGGPSDQPAARKAAPPPVEKPMDESRRFPAKDRVKIELVDNHLLGKDFLPGGNLAEYRRDGKTFQQFLIRTKSPEAAALLMFEFKDQLAEAKYLPHFGGYFGKDGDQLVFVFPKDVFVAGIVGLPEKEADLQARDFAARLN